MPSDVSITSKSTTPLSTLMQNSPTLAKSGRRRSAFELVNAHELAHVCTSQSRMAILYGRM